MGSVDTGEIGGGWRLSYRLHDGAISRVRETPKVPRWCRARSSAPVPCDGRRSCAAGCVGIPHRSANRPQCLRFDRQEREPGPRLRRPDGAERFAGDPLCRLVLGPERTVQLPDTAQQGRPSESHRPNPHLHAPPQGERGRGARRRQLPPEPQEAALSRPQDRPGHRTRPSCRTGWDQMRGAGENRDLRRHLRRVSDRLPGTGSGTSRLQALLYAQLSCPIWPARKSAWRSCRDQATHLPGGAQLATGRAGGEGHRLGNRYAAAPLRAA